MAGFLRKQEWTREELRKQGFREFPRKKEIVMARLLPAEEAPLTIRTSWGDSLIAQAGYMICYSANGEKKEKLSDYEHWPVERGIFSQTYKAWDEEFSPTEAQYHLIQLECKPYYKVAAVWAKILDEDIYIQGQEHLQPILVSKERVLAIGKEGEPYQMGAETFADRYDARLLEKGTVSPIKRIVNRLVGFFKKE